MSDEASRPEKATLPAFRRPWHSRMGARDPGEVHRASTPLELLFDLCFVVAIAQASEQLAHAIEEGHLGTGALGYMLVFFAIWWAWVNFTWFASAYDCDGVPYRLLTLLQMAGALVLAAGVPAAMTQFDLTVPVIGYVIMRVAMIGHWLRAAAEDPVNRPTTLRYAGGIAAVQVLWVLSLLLGPGLVHAVAIVVLILAEVSVPAWAERNGRQTSWHPEHIAERYGLLTLIVLGECVLGTTVAIQRGFTEGGGSLDLILLAVGGLLLIFSLWWTYFIGGDEHGLTSMRVALTWGYGHYFVFGGIGVLAAGLEAAVGVSSHESHAAPAVVGLTIGVAVSLFLVVISQLRRLSWPSGTENNVIVVVLSVVALVIGGFAGTLGIGLAVLLMGLVVGAGLAAYLAVASRRAHRTLG